MIKPNKDPAMNRTIISLALVIVLILPSLTYTPPEISALSVPPTPAIKKIITDNGTITAKNYSATIKIIGSGAFTTSGNNITNTITIGGNGFPNRVSNIAIFNQSATNGTLTGTLYTAPTSGVYRVSVYQEPNIAGSSGTISTLIIWTDQAAQTRGQVAAPDSQLNGLNYYEEGSIFIDVQGTTNITYQSTITGVKSGTTINLFITLERIS